jgi:hypothetical protein
MNRLYTSYILGIYFAYTLLMLCIYFAYIYKLYKLYGLGRFGLVPSLRGGLGSGLRIRVSSGGLGGGKSPPYWDILKRKGPTG